MRAQCVRGLGNEARARAKARAHQVFIAIARTYTASLRQRDDNPDYAYCYTTGCGIRHEPNRNLWDMTRICRSLVRIRIAAAHALGSIARS